MPRGVKNFKIPSDLQGITVATYEPERLGDDPRAALQTACYEITRAIENAVKADVDDALTRPRTLRPSNRRRCLSAKRN